MYKYIPILFITAYIFSCTPKAATTKTPEFYEEDLSAYRPVIEKETTEEPIDIGIDAKGPYVAPTHDINNEMSALMDSIISYNRTKTFLTYTIQVYIGRSREEANQVREKVYRVFPDQKPTLSWRQPSWLVTVGEFAERVDAYKTYTVLRNTFPGATLVPEWKTVE
jgi:hypothetical protein